jgi:hypothetical protein
MAVLWDVEPCSFVEIDWRFRGAYCLHHQGDEWTGNTSRLASRFEGRQISERSAEQPPHRGLLGEISGSYGDEYEDAGILYVWANTGIVALNTSLSVLPNSLSL